MAARCPCARGRTRRRTSLHCGTLPELRETTRNAVTARDGALHLRLASAPAGFRLKLVLAARVLFAGGRHGRWPAPAETQTMTIRRPSSRGLVGVDGTHTRCSRWDLRQEICGRRPAESRAAARSARTARLRAAARCRALCVRRPQLINSYADSDTAGCGSCAAAPMRMDKGAPAGAISRATGAKLTDGEAWAYSPRSSAGGAATPGRTASTRLCGASSVGTDAAGNRY